MADNRPQEKEIFNTARQIAAPEERLAYLEQACGHDPATMHRVLELLRIHDQEKSFLKMSPAAVAATINMPIAEHAGAVIGPYKLLEKIGEGGFGVVYLAEQTQPLRRRVALKVLKPGMDTRQVVARFEAERQALAIMDHPHIAKVHDGGATPSGRPYFVMELVKGLPITEFCDQNHLTPRQRLELFVPVCQAVQHAHQKGIIHRDLKPSNVLVAVHDTNPVVKVIDFGVAKALGQELTDKTLFTGFAQMVGTPLYMSPEQAGQSGLDVDTRSDIYSLGVLLYELLTGTTPFTRERFKQAAYDEIRRIIREEEPPRPSTRLVDSKDSLPSISALRGTEPAKLTKLVHGELDWIVMKALEKDRNRRYEAANGFARDIERYLRDEPVQACPPSPAYRFGKFARRHKVGLAMVSLVIAAVLSTIGILAVSNVRIAKEKGQKETALEQAKINQETAEHERQRAEDNLNVALQALDGIYLELADDRIPRDPSAKKKDEELLKKALGFYQQFAQQNSDHIPLRLQLIRAFRRVGDIQRLVGDHPAARVAYRSALARATALATELPSDTEFRYEQAACHNALGAVLEANVPEAADHYLKAITLLTRLTDDHPADASYRAELAKSHHGLAVHLKTEGERAAAQARFGQALDIQSKLADDFPAVPRYRLDLADLHRGYGMWLEGGHWLSSTPEEVDHVRQGRKLLADLVEEFPAVPLYRFRLAGIIQDLATFAGDPAGRIKEYNGAIENLNSLIAEFPRIADYRSLLATCDCNLGEIYWMSGNWESAEPYWKRSLDLTTTLIADHPQDPDYWRQHAVSLENWGSLLLCRGEVGKARKAIEESLHLGQEAFRAYPHSPYHAQVVIFDNCVLSGIAATEGAQDEAARRRQNAHQLFGETWRELRQVRGPLVAASFCEDLATGLTYLINKP
jgi:serine/threonine protein kinase